MLNVSIKEIKLKSIEDRVILSGINFVLEKNNIYTVLGRNGSGKSTLLKSIPRLLDSRFYSVEGKIFFEGKDIFSLNEPELLSLRKDKIKYILQDAINSFDHLKKFKYYFEKVNPDFSEADDLLKYFLLPGSDKLFKLYPYEVSGGMAQRISFVLALLSHPKVILLDEPTSGIDPAISNLFLLKLKEFAAINDNCAMLVTHDVLFATKAGGKIAFLSNCNLSGFSSPDNFLSENNLKEPFLDSYSEINL